MCLKQKEKGLVSVRIRKLGYLARVCFGGAERCVRVCVRACVGYNV